jgi:hypothetical protein
MWRFLLLVYIGLIWMRIYLLKGFYAEILANLKRVAEVKQTGGQALSSFILLKIIDGRVIVKEI